LKRFYVKSTLGKDIEITGQEHIHLSQVLRAQIGENVIFCCGDEFDYEYEILKIAKNSTLLKFIKSTPNVHNPKACLAVYMAAIKPDNLNLVVQKLNEIGVRKLVIFDSERSNVSVQNLRLDRLESIAEQSCKQCMRSIPLKVECGKLDCLSGYNKVFFANECDNRKHLGEIITGVDENIALIIGPEGGFTEEERGKILANKNVISVSLGVRIFRAETAAIAAASIILSKMGEI